MDNLEEEIENLLKDISSHELDEEDYDLIKELQSKDEELDSESLDELLKYLNVEDIDEINLDGGTIKPSISYKPSTSRKPSEMPDNLPFTDKGFQSPIKSNAKCSGRFSLSPTDPRHPAGHMGVDLRAPGGTSIYPMMPGIVTSTNPNNKGGYVVYIDHKNGLKTYYAHCGTINVKAGDTVDYNTVIATVGDSGNARGTWPHLHFEVSKNGIKEDPAKYFSVPPYEEPTKDEKKWMSPEASEEAANFKIQNKKIANISKYESIYKLSKFYNSLANRLKFSMQF